MKSAAGRGDAYFYSEMWTFLYQAKEILHQNHECPHPSLGRVKASPKKKFIISEPRSENDGIINIEKCPTRGRGGEGNLFFSESEYILTFRIGDPALVKRNRVSRQWRLVLLGC